MLEMCCCFVVAVLFLFSINHNTWTATCLSVCVQLCTKESPLSVTRFNFCGIFAVFVSVSQIFSVPNIAGALSTPRHTPCNEAVPWSGMRGLINLVYLLGPPWASQNAAWGPSAHLGDVVAAGGRFLSIVPPWAHVSRSWGDISPPCFSIFPSPTGLLISGFSSQLIALTILF